MDLNKTIRARRSIRKYKKRMIKRDAIINLIDSARWAPSACNYQNWYFIVVDKKEILKKLYNSGAIHVKLSPVSIFVFYDKRFVNKLYCDHIQSASAAIENMLLKAYDLGLGTCWVCHLPKEKRIKHVLNVPWNYQLIAMVNLGYPDENPKPSKRKPLDKIMSFNRYEGGIPEKLGSKMEQVKKRPPKLVRFFWGIIKRIRKF